MVESGILSQNEIPLYGSSRLGQRTFAPGVRDISNTLDDSKLDRTRGQRYYEQSNHLEDRRGHAISRRDCMSTGTSKGREPQVRGEGDYHFSNHLHS